MDTICSQFVLVVPDLHNATSEARGPHPLWPCMGQLDNQGKRGAVQPVSGAGGLQEVTGCVKSKPAKIKLS